MPNKMKDLQNDMDKIFRDKLGDYQQQAPEEIWIGIKAGLGKKPTRKILIPLWQVAAGMALFITIGSALYFLNRTPQNQLADQFMIVPHNVQTAPELAKSGNNEAKPEIAKESEIRKTRVLDSGKSEKGQVIASNGNNGPLEITKKNLQTAHIEEIRSDQMLKNGLSADRMTAAYIQSSRKDEIPRKKITITPNWDMLTAGLEVIPEDELSYDKLSLTAQVSPTYSYRDIGGKGSEKFSQYETGKISYSGGLQFGIKTSERLSFYGGVMYAQLGYNIDNVERFNDYALVNNTDIVSVPESRNEVYSVNNSIGTISAASDKGKFIGTNGFSRGDKAYESANSDYLSAPVLNSTNKEGAKIEQYFQYLELPFLVRYKIIDRKLDVNLLGGVSTNILVGNHATLNSGDQTSNIGGSGDVRNLNYMGNMGLGFDYSIRKNLVFTVEPQFKYFLNSINESQLVANRPYLLGMFTGVKYVW